MNIIRQTRPRRNRTEQSTPRDDEVAERIAQVGAAEEVQRSELIINCLENIDI